MGAIRFGATALLLATVASSSAFTQENWWHWRGPTADGRAAVSADPPIEWGNDKNIRWAAAIPGNGSATPIVWGDDIYVVTAVETNRQAAIADLPKVDPKFEKKTDAPRVIFEFRVLRFDRATGKLKGQVTAAEEVPHEGHHETHSYAAGSPTCDGSRLYVSFGSFGMYAFDRDLKQLWARKIGRLNTRLGWGEAVTPVVSGDSLFLNWDQEAESKLYCLNAKTGEIRWVVDRDEKTSWNTPLVVTHNGISQVILNGTTKIRSYDSRTGAEIWRCGGMTVNAIPSPVTDGKHVFVMSGYRGSAAVAVPLDARGDVSESAKLGWRYAKGTPYVPSPLLVDGKLWFTQANQNLLTVVDAKSGKAIVDRERLTGVAGFYSSPVWASGRIYLVDRSGTTVVLKDRAEKLEVLAVNKLNEPIDASPIAVDKQLILRGRNKLFCIEAK